MLFEPKDKIEYNHADIRAIRYSSFPRGFDPRYIAWTSLFDEAEEEMRRRLHPGDLILADKLNIFSVKRIMEVLGGFQSTKTDFELVLRKQSFLEDLVWYPHSLKMPQIQPHKLGKYEWSLSGVQTPIMFLGWVSFQIELENDKIRCSLPLDKIKPSGNFCDVPIFLNEGKKCGAILIQQTHLIPCKREK
jgi:hypothetical protein